MYELTAQQTETARRIADQLIVVAMQPHDSLGEGLLATSMLLAAKLRLAFAGVRPINAELVERSIDLVRLAVFKQLVEQCSQHCAADVAEYVPLLEQQLAAHDLAFMSPAGNA